MRGASEQDITISVDIFNIGLVMSKLIFKSLMLKIYTSDINLTVLNNGEYLIGTVL